MNFFNYIHSEDNLENIKQKIVDLNLEFKYYNEDDLILVKYNKSTLTLYNNIIRDCRGLIFSPKEIKIKCVPPRKSDNINEYINILQEGWSNVKIEEFIDGTMINYFYHNNKWYISTRSCLNAECKWNNENTFKELIDDTQNDELSKLDNTKFNKNYTYTFVLTHPKNRIVTKYDIAKLILVNIININSFETEDIYKFEFENFNKPKRYDFVNLNELKDSLNKLEYTQQGFVIKFGNLRFKLRNEKYTIVKNLKYNTYSKLLLFLKLYTLSKTSEYLKYFPEDREIFKEYNNLINILIKSLFNHYVGKFIKKNNIVIPQLYKKSIYDIHSIYLSRRNGVNGVNGINIRIDKNDIMNYIKKQDSNLLFKILNNTI